MQKTVRKKHRRIGRAYRQIAKASRLKRFHRKVMKKQKAMGRRL